MLFGVFNCSLLADDRVKGLEAQLASVQQDIEQHYTRIAEKGAEYVRFKENVVYEKNDDSIRIYRLYQQIVDLERELVKKRSELDQLVQSHPKGRAIATERNGLFQSVSKLKATKKAIEAELRLAKKSAAGGVQK